jgi:hypothetical protein
MTKLSTLVVSDKPETVAVYQKSKGVWVGRAPYMGRPIRVEDRSEVAAPEYWQEAAEGEAAARKTTARNATGARAVGNKGKPRQPKS